jgi:hypothetical protein
MQPYLPKEGSSGSPYSEGGALYALGLIHANHGSDIRQFLLDSLRAASNPIIQHGGCLGLGGCPGRGGGGGGRRRTSKVVVLTVSWAWVGAAGAWMGASQGRGRWATGS